MDPNTPMVLAAGRYNDRESAVQDFRDIWREKHKGEFDHIAAAVVTKNEQGELQVERHDSSGKHVAWGGALVGAALVVIAPPAGIGALATVGAFAGAGGIVGHLWRNIPKGQVTEASELLDSGESGLLVVAVNPLSDLESLLSRADKSVTFATVAGDLDAAFKKAVLDAQQAKAGATV